MSRAAEARKAMRDYYQGAHYSQHDEQSVILEWAMAQDAPGAFLDLGCYDGVTYSNTAALADLGWSGICIDASPDAIATCAVRYAERPDVRVILAAFTTEDGEGPALVHWSPNAQYTSLLPGRRPTNPHAAIEVPRVELAWLAARLNSLPTPLFASIDLEGNSLDALAWLMQSSAEVGCLCVEANNPGERRQVREWLSGGWRELPGNASNLLWERL